MKDQCYYGPAVWQDLVARSPVSIELVFEPKYGLQFGIKPNDPQPWGFPSINLPKRVRMVWLSSMDYQMRFCDRAPQHTQPRTVNFIGKDKHPVSACSLFETYPAEAFSGIKVPFYYLVELTGNSGRSLFLTQCMPLPFAVLEP